MLTPYCKLMGNYFQVNKYLENYERALSGFEAAALKDPGLNAGEEVQKIVNLLDKLENSMKVMFSSFFIFLKAILIFLQFKISC